MGMKLWSLEGNGQKLDGGSMFGNAPRPVWERWLAPDDLGRVPLACRCLLVEIEGQKILCEVGIGAFFEPKLAERFGVENFDRHVLLDSLAAAGFREEEIDWVVLSHLHFDHAGGLLPTYESIQAGNEKLLFPNAKYVVGKSAWERSVNPHFRDRASFIPGLSKKLEESGRLKIVEGDSLEGFFPDKISFRYSEGHTPGQMHAVFSGEEKKVIFCGDLIPGRPWVHLPITMGYDRFPERLIEEKEQLYRDLDENTDILFYTHDPQVAASSFAKGDKGKYQVCHEIAQMAGYPL